MKRLLSVATLILASLPAMPILAQSVIQPEEWQSYLDAYVEDSGRVVDALNGNISHSESQGYGLWLAVLAEDRASFERIWSFTSTEMMVREDGLLAWRWEPDADPHVTDTNNATDGDMLVAYALHRASALWNQPEYGQRAAEMVRTIGQTMLTEVDGMPAILPGEHGFIGLEDDPEPIVNLSYWIFETLPVFAEIDPETDWNAISDTGLEISRRAALTKAGVPADWVRLKDGGIEAAPEFAPEFGYNNIRVPIYMIRAGINPDYLGPYRRASDAEGLYKINVNSGARIEPINEPGYRLIHAAMECVAAGTPVPEELRTMAATSYYAATLQLLLLDHLRRNNADCVGGGGS